MQRRAAGRATAAARRISADNARMPVASVVLGAFALAALLVQGPTPDLRALIGATFPARVTAVIDGDTIDVVRAGSAALRLRLEGIDSPESGEPFSNVARTRVRVLAFDQDVRVEGRDVDRYGRLVARVVTRTGADSVDLSVALVSEGLACHYTQYSSDATLARAESAARAAGRGFWARDAQKPRCAVGSAPPTPSSPVGAVYHGNTRSRVYHAPTCPNYNCPNCTRRFASRADAEADGFKPAGDCLRREVH